jgi:hypothetical protein
LGLVTAALVFVGATALAVQPPAAWREAPEFVPLFAPAGVQAGAYRAYVSHAGLDEVLRGLDGDRALVRAPGSWQPRALAPADAFGQAGRYNRWRMARLYGAERAIVARGARRENGRVVESWTLISPYPDPSLRQLERGTLRIVLRYDFLTPDLR